MSPLTTFDEEIGLDEKMIYYNIVDNTQPVDLMQKAQTLRI